jgi:hypothetical protein
LLRGDGGGRRGRQRVRRSSGQESCRQGARLGCRCSRAAAGPQSSAPQCAPPPAPPSCRGGAGAGPPDHPYRSNCTGWILHTSGPGGSSRGGSTARQWAGAAAGTAVPRGAGWAGAGAWAATAAWAAAAAWAAGWGSRSPSCRSPGTPARSTPPWWCSCSLQQRRAAPALLSEQCAAGWRAAAAPWSAPERPPPLALQALRLSGRGQPPAAGAGAAPPTRVAVVLVERAVALHLSLPGGHPARRVVDAGRVVAGHAADAVALERLYEQLLEGLVAAGMELGVLVLCADGAAAAAAAHASRHWPRLEDGISPFCSGGSWRCSRPCWRVQPAAAATQQAASLYNSPWSSSAAFGPNALHHSELSLAGLHSRALLQTVSSQLCTGFSWPRLKHFWVAPVCWGASRAPRSSTSSNGGV